MAETPEEAYDRGELAGTIAARLANHDTHFAAINGSIADMVTEVHAQNLLLQELRDANITVKTTKEAKRARVDHVAFLFGTIAGIVGLVLFAVTIIFK